MLLFFTCMQAYGQGMYYYVKDTVTAKTDVPNTKVLDKLSDKAVVTFRDAPAAKYAFDTYNSVYDKALQIKSSYEHIGSYHVNNKAILPNEKDIVEASIQINDAGIKPEEIAFVTDKGNKFEHSYDKGIYTITILGGGANDGQRLYAVYKNADGKYESLGKLNIYSYAPKKQDVYIVPVKDKQGNTLSFDINAVQEELQKTYGKIGVTFNISVKEPIAYGDWDKNGDNKLQVSGSGLFTQYTPEMKALNNAVAKAYGVEKDKLYLLLVNEGDAKEGSPHGDMPRNQQFGYLFNGYTPRTVAHEIGHGAFSLQHTFEKTYQVPENSTDNLMDYKGGNVLIKHQWDIIHSPGTVIQLWEGDDEGLEINFDRGLSDIDKKKISNALTNIINRSSVFNFVYNLTKKNKEDITFMYADSRDITYTKGEAGHIVPFALDLLTKILKGAEYRNIIYLSKRAFEDIKVLEGVIFEELLHYAQFKYYGLEKVIYLDNSEDLQPKCSVIQREAEVRLFKVVGKTYLSYGQSYWTDKILDKENLIYDYINSLANTHNNSEVQDDVLQSFKEVYIMIAKAIAPVYKVKETELNEFINQGALSPCFDYYFRTFKFKN